MQYILLRPRPLVNISRLRGSHLTLYKQPINPYGLLAFRSTKHSSRQHSIPTALKHKTRPCTGMHKTSQPPEKARRSLTDQSIHFLLHRNSHAHLFTSHHPPPSWPSHSSSPIVHPPDYPPGLVSACCSGYYLNHSPPPGSCPSHGAVRPPASALPRVSWPEAGELPAWPYHLRPGVEGVPVVQVQVQMLVPRHRLLGPRPDHWRFWRATILFMISIVCTKTIKKGLAHHWFLFGPPRPGRPF